MYHFWTSYVLYASSCSDRDSALCVVICDRIHSRVASWNIRHVCIVCFLASGCHVPVLLRCCHIRLDPYLVHVVAFSLLRYPCTCDVFKHYYRSTMYFPCSSLHRLLRGQAFTVQAVLQLVFIYVTTRLCPSRIRYDSNLKFLIHLWNIFPLVFLLVRVFLVCLPCGLHLSIQRTMIIASIIYYGRHYHTEETSAGASL